MRPKFPVYTLEKCNKQTQDLFDSFLGLNIQHEELLEKKRLSREFHDEYIKPAIQRDSSRSSQSGNDFSPLLSRSPGFDTRRFSSEIAEKRRSIELAQRKFATTPPPESGVQRDRGSPPKAKANSIGLLPQPNNVQALEPQADYGEPLERAEHDVRHQRLEKENKEYVEFPHEQEQRERSYSTGPTEEQIREAARVIMEVGDKIEQEYGGRLQSISEQLTSFVQSQQGKLTYEVFAAHVNDLIGENREWTNFMFMMHLSKRVITTTHSVGSNTIGFFRRFVGAAFAEQVAQNNGVVTFVREGGLS